MAKVGLVLEGGAMRGMFTAGVLDVFMDNNIDIDAIIGVSAGALFGVNYFSKQKGRAIRYSKRFCKDLRYISIPSLVLTGNIVNKNFAYYKVSKKLDPFDNETYKNNKGKFYATATNIKSGQPEYLEVNSVLDDMELLRASSAMPLVTKPVIINNKYYLDGAISDSIPIQKMIDLGYDKIIVVLTRPLDYRKEELSTDEIAKIKKKYKDYPKLIDLMISRPKRYNKTLEVIASKESKKEIFVIRPSHSINVKVIERDENVLEQVYKLGINDTNKCIDELKKYLRDK